MSAKSDPAGFAGSGLSQILALEFGRILAVPRHVKRSGTGRDVPSGTARTEAISKRFIYGAA